MIVPLSDLLSEIRDGQRRLNKLKQTFIDHYDAEPAVVVSAPGRTEIIGNHTDHNNGRVVAAAIQQCTLVVAGPPSGEGETCHLRSKGWDRTFTVDPAHPEKITADPDAHDTERLMLGVVEGLARYGFHAPGYRACMDSSVLPGSGLSSSAAVEIALVGVHGALSGEDIPPLRAALVGKYAENHYMRKPSGLMDQLASALGGMHAIDFSDPDAPLIHRIEVDFTSTNHHLAVVNTGGSHANLTEQYGAVSREMHAAAQALGVRNLAETDRKQLLAHLSVVRKKAGDRAVLRALHFFEEQNRVFSFVDAADSRLNQTILHLMTESGDSSARLLQNVHTGSARDQALALGLELTRTYLHQRGATGAFRVHGGGFAGTMLVVIPEDLMDEYRTAMQRAFGEGAFMPLQIRQQGLVTASLTKD